MSDEKPSQPRSVIWEGHFARAVITDLDPRTGVSNIIVQVKDARGWRDAGDGYNSISDDFAYTNAREDAQRREKRLSQDSAG